jgi:hypothetical protein
MNIVNISRGTAELCQELLSQSSVPVAVPDANAKMARLVAAYQELIAALSASGNGQPAAGDPLMAQYPVR